MQVGGGRVLVHRHGHESEGRETVFTRPMDRHCQLCGGWHMFDHEHLERLRTIGADFRARLTALGVPRVDAEVAVANARTVTFLAGHQ